MKLPKPGKIKPRKPRAEKPAGNREDILSKIGGFRIKNKFLQKNLISLIVIAVLAIGTGTVYGTLNSRDADRGEDPVYGVNQDRYQVLVSGEGYKLSKKQEKDYKLQKKQNEVNAANALQDPNTISYSNGSRTFRSSSSYRSVRYRYNSHYSYKSSKKPRVTSDVSSEINKLDNPVAGDTFKIKVTAYAYPYGTKNAISSNNIKVKVEGGAATLYKSKSGSHYYKIELGEGKNKITISATDKKTKKTTKLGPYTVKAGAGKTESGNSENTDNSNTNPTQESKTPETPNTQDINKPVTATADLSAFGLGKVSLNGVVVTKDSTAFEVLSNIDEITMDGQDIESISLDTGSFSLDGFSSDKLQAIYREECNISGEIDPGDYTEWQDEIENAVKERGYLGKDCPFSSTKWTYDSSKTGEELAVSGITLTLVLYEE